MAQPAPITPQAEVRLLLYPGCQMAILHGVTDLLQFASGFSERRKGPTMRVSHWSMDAAGTIARSYNTHSAKEGHPNVVIAPERKRQVDQIARAVSYEDMAAFRRLFRRLVGLSPGDHRRRFGSVQGGTSRRWRRTKVSPADLLLHIRTEIRFETGLASERLNSFISSQSFLVIAYASSMASSNARWEQVFTILIPPFLALLGLALSVLAWPGIIASQAVIERWREKERDLLGGHPDLLERTLVADDAGRADIDRRRLEGALFARRAPLVFVVAWCWLAALPIWLHRSA